MRPACTWIHSNLPTTGVCRPSYLARKAEKWVFWVFLGVFDITKGPKRGPKAPRGWWRPPGEWVGWSLSNLPTAGVCGPRYLVRKAEKCAFWAFLGFFDLPKGSKRGPKAPRGGWRPPGAWVGSSHSNLPTAGVCGPSYFAQKAEKCVFWAFLGVFDITKGPKRGPKAPRDGRRPPGE